MIEKATMLRLTDRYVYYPFKGVNQAGLCGENGSLEHWGLKALNPPDWSVVFFEVYELMNKNDVVRLKLNDKWKFSPVL